MALAFTTHFEPRKRLLTWMARPVSALALLLAWQGVTASEELPVSPNTRAACAGMACPHCRATPRTGKARPDG